MSAMLNPIVSTISGLMIGGGVAQIILGGLTNGITIESVFLLILGIILIVVNFTGLGDYQRCS